MSSLRVRKKKLVLELSHIKEENSILLTKDEIGKEVKGGCDVLGLVVVEENDELSEISPVIRLVFEKFHDVVMKEISSSLPPMHNI